jgi:hypothetical protein
MSNFAKDLVAKLARSYQKSVSKRLQEAGLKYEDLLVEKDYVVRALSRTDNDIIVER